MPQSLMPVARHRYFNNDGTVAAGCLLYTYAAGTSTPKATYTDSAGLVPHANPIVLDAKGEAVIYWDGAYKVDLKTAAGVQITGYPVDDYTPPTDTLRAALSAPTGASLVVWGSTTLADQLTNRINRVVSTIAALKTLDKTKYTKAFVTGYYADGDGGGGAYYYDSSDTTSSDNGGTIIVADDGARWKLAQAAPVSARQFGLRGVGDEAALLTKFFAAGRALRWEQDLEVTVNSQVVIPASGFNLVAEKGAKVTAGASMQSIFLAADKDDVFIYGLEFDLNSNTQIGMYFRADATNASGLEVYGCKLSNSSADITLQYGLVCVDATGGAAGSFKPKNIRINGNQFANGLTHGCLVAYATNVDFCNNWIDTMSNHGMEAVQCKNVSILNNKVDNCTLSALGVGTFVRKWEIANNQINNCGGDGSITIEHNCIEGSCHDNVVTDCNTVGINFSYGTGGADPFDKIQRVSIHDNVLVAKEGVTTYQGINIYSTTGTGVGKGIRVHNNTFVGFNGGMTAAYLADCSFMNNKANDLTGTNSYVAKLTFVVRSEFGGWKSDTDTGDHAIQLLDFAGNTCDRVNVHDNYVLAAGSAAKSMVLIEGTGTHCIYANGTGGALHHVEATGASTYTYGGNYGNLAGTTNSGGTATAW